MTEMQQPELDELAEYIGELLRAAREAHMEGREEEAAELYAQVAQLELGHDGHDE